ncbi:MAG: type II toxin-antitoxin system RelE/ParE family toxin [Flavobacteriales bacterium]|nr:type II toxin-antitoxin system RelE/ParE family toxin [Flavobacteriales bacterium]MBK9196571.1 type II toxin-antitoxin system RelE/ParE family toxin [Flavobacteriales bacterium]
MSYEVKYSPVFERAIKRLAKKYPSVRKDLAALIEELSETPFVGSPLGKDCYKVRMAIRSKGKGRSGGARVITCVKVVRNVVILLTVYDKSEVDTISDKELERLLVLIG